MDRREPICALQDQRRRMWLRNLAILTEREVLDISREMPTPEQMKKIADALFDDACDPASNTGAQSYRFAMELAGMILPEETADEET